MFYIYFSIKIYIITVKWLSVNFNTTFGVIIYACSISSFCWNLDTKSTNLLCNLSNSIEIKYCSFFIYIANFINREYRKYIVWIVIVWYVSALLQYTQILYMLCLHNFILIQKGYHHLKEQLLAHMNLVYASGK